MTKNKIETIFGMHAVESVLRNDPANILEIWVEAKRSDKRFQQLIEEVKRLGLKLEYLKKKDIENRCDSNKTQGVGMRYRRPPAASDAQTEQSIAELIKKDNVFLLILDGVQDPHNLGACLRTADAAGVDAVIVPKDRAVGITSTVRKVACGAAESVPFIQVTNLARTLKELRDEFVWIVGAAGDAETSLYDVKLDGKLAIIMGAEESGLRHLTREHCDQLVKLPMSGQMESLNVSVATGVCLFEAVRQRLVKTTK